MALTFLDAHALIDFLTGGPALEAVTQLLRGDDTAVATANIAETCDISARRFKIPVAGVMDLLEPLLGAVLTVVPLDLPTAVRAGALRAEHYARAARPLSLGDAVLLASASRGDKIATADPLVLELAQAIGVTPLRLPSGR